MVSRGLPVHSHAEATFFQLAALMGAAFQKHKENILADSRRIAVW
jgi:hypothetical protein